MWAIEGIMADKKFWKSFATTYWEKRSVCLTGIKSSIFNIDSDCIFKLLVRYSDHCRKTKTLVGMKFYIEGHLQYLDDVLDLLPKSKDGSLLGYHRRMDEMFFDYCLVCDELIQVAPEEWKLLGEFVMGLYDQVGLPSKFAEMGLYLGNYRTTPFGVHSDGCGVISIPVEGTKKFLVWNSKFVEKNPKLKRTHQYKAYRKHADRWVANPGDIVYWPASHWHIAESTGAFSATWSIGFWLDEPLSEIILKALKPLLATTLSDCRSIALGDGIREDGLIEALPEVLNLSHSELVRISSDEMHDVFVKYWLEIVSKNGFRNSPPNLGTKNRLVVQEKIFWTKLSHQRICVAAKGILQELPDSPKWVTLIQSINSGKIVDLKYFSQKELNLFQKIYPINKK